MGRKRLITDTFQVVKKRKQDSKEVKEAPSLPHETVTLKAEPALQDAIQPDQLETLKQFDLSWEYGPCTGITRLQRWERAKLLGLRPPATVQELLLKYREDSIIMHRGTKVDSVEFEGSDWNSKAWLAVLGSLWHEYSL